MVSRSWRLLTRRSENFLLEQDWTKPLEEMGGNSFVEVARGTHRHVVRFLNTDQGIYALKELPGRLATIEYRLLRQMAEDGLPVVDVLGVVQRDGMDDVLVTRYLDFALPYRHLFATRFGVPAAPELANRLLDALSSLLVRLHIAGYYWGDCSLNNTLLRRDAGALAAYVVDMETGERHESLTDGQRETDLEITELNVAGGLMDVEAELGLSIGMDPVDTAAQVRLRYERLWAELTEPVLIGEGERWRIDQRIRRLNDLGFHVDEVTLEPAEVDGSSQRRLRMQTLVTETGFHRRRLAQLTGLQAEENQARKLLNDLESFRLWAESVDGRPLPRSAAAYRWLAESFEPTVQQIPDDLRDRIEPAEVFLSVLYHKWIMSREAGTDVGLAAARKAFLQEELPKAPTEKVVTSDVVAPVDGSRGFG